MYANNHCAIRFMATGESMTSIMYSFRTGKTETVVKTILDCCTILRDELHDKVGI